MRAGGNALSWLTYAAVMAIFLSVLLHDFDALSKVSKYILSLAAGVTLLNGFVAGTAVYDAMDSLHDEARR